MDNKENDITVHALVVSTAIVSFCAGWLLCSLVNSAADLASAVADRK